jgi:tRNA A-37 threonylcarbamoyl transferase component Bud32
MIDLKSLKKIASGGQAEIFEIGSGRVLRLLYNEDYMHLIEYEFKSLEIAKQNGIYVPAVYEIVTVAGRPGIIMERIDGETMAGLLSKTPLLLFQKARELGALHYNLNMIEAPEGFIGLKSSIKSLVGKSEFIDKERKDFVYKILEQLPSGHKLCHGDFHPGNIIVRDGRPYIIDWTRPASADPVADAAHTYLILRNMPRLPGISYITYQFMKFGGLLAAKTYYKSYNSHYKIDGSLFSKWLLVRAAERTYFGLPSEKKALVKFISRCYNDYADGKELNWRKFL